MNVCVTMIPQWDNVTSRGGFLGSGSEEWTRCEMCHEEFSRGVTQLSHFPALMFMIENGFLIWCGRDHKTRGICMSDLNEDDEVE